MIIRRKKKEILTFRRFSVSIRANAFDLLQEYFALMAMLATGILLTLVNPGQYCQRMEI